MLEVLDGIVASRGTPSYIRMDNGPEFISKVIEEFASEMGITLYFIEVRLTLADRESVSRSMEDSETSF